MRFTAVAGCCLLAAVAWLIPSADAQTLAPDDLAAARNYYLNDLITLPDYSPGKNSFLVQRMHRGDRKTLLDLRGNGEVRHIWSTWSTPGDDSDIPVRGRVLLHVFIDGESKSAISGPLDDLSRSAEATANRFVPLPAFNFKGAFNIYLPISFARGIRIEIEATDEIAEFYVQIDYRTAVCARLSPRLVSQTNGDTLTLKYLGDVGMFHPSANRPGHTTRQSVGVNYGPSANAGELSISGPGILRSLTFRGPSLSDLELRIYCDDDAEPGLQAPLRYLFADFRNVAMESGPDESTCYFPMPFRKEARIVIRSLSGKVGRATVDYALEAGPLPARVLYFHALYHETEKTVGYEPHTIVRVRGEGLFVGMNLFESGHNHGGGDTTLIDAGSTEPKVLHGICGEDYFGFAWHHTGTMTLLTGAPVHERRYRLHLENPYPFHESLQSFFGVFAGHNPKSVAFWYQLPEAAPEDRWTARDVPWKILGPLGLETAIPDEVTDRTYATVALIKDPTSLMERWQDAEMRHGFLDATFEFRHYSMIESGTGYIAGAGKTQMRAYLYSPSRRHVSVVVGHDDRLILQLNGATIADIRGRSGFGPARITLKLHAGWNTLNLVVYNDENVNWRWCGISFALDRKASEGLRFARQLPARATDSYSQPLP
ncbi:MAG: DUF2961 domain-containing protein [Candidatus Sulfotelmatobacter sp.]